MRGDLIASLVAFAVVSLAMPLIIRLLMACRVYDIPNERSSHSVVVPRGGGLSVVGGTLVGALAASISQFPDFISSVLGMAMAGFALLGLFDDLVGLSAILRLVIQGVAGLVLSFVLLGAQVASSPASWFFIALGGVWIATFVNAFNFMDGINGISGVSGALAALWFGYWASVEGDGTTATWAWALAGAAVGFLPWNAPRARVFLGDVGSYGIGALLGGLALATWVRTESPALAFAPLLVYLADTAGTLVERALRGKPVMQAHRSHVYQRLTNLGLTHMNSTAVVGLFTTTCCGIVALAAPAWTPVLIVAVLAAYLLLPILLARRARTIE